MATKVRKKSSEKIIARARRKKRIRSRVSGDGERPRLVVFRSNRHIYAQIVDDTKAHTLVAACTVEEEVAKTKPKGGINGAKAAGALVAKRALAKKISQVVFDRGGFIYHGQIKALADSAREAGLKF